jgi:hypothetical protein
MKTNITNCLHFSAVRSLGAALIIAGALSGTASAQLFSENFSSYANGDLAGQNGWAQFGADASDPVQVLDGFAILSLGQDVSKSFTSSFDGAAGGSIQATVNLTIYNATTSGDYFFALSDGAGYTGNVYAKAVSGGFVFGLRPSNTGSIIYGTEALSFGQNHTMSLTLDYLAGAGNDGLSLAVNGTDHVAYSDAFDFGNPGYGTTMLNAVRLRQGSANAPYVEVSGIEVQAVPEPSTYALLLAVGAIGVLAARKRKATSQSHA